MESLPRLSEEPECGGGCYPTQNPGRVLISRLRRDQKVVAVQTVSEPEIYHGAGFKLRADARACRVIGCPYL